MKIVILILIIILGMYQILKDILLFKKMSMLNKLNHFNSEKFTYYDNKHKHLMSLLKSITFTLISVLLCICFVLIMTHYNPIK